jgi:hypothetical protein
MAAVADHKKIKLDTADVHIGYRIHPGKKWLTAFTIQIDLGRGLTKRERTILFNSARLCEVAKLLGGEKKFEYELLPRAG